MESLGLRTLADKEVLQSAVNTFCNLDGRVVTLVAVEPIGMPEYYAQLRNVVDVLAAAGATVRKEHVRGGVDESQARNDTEIEGLRALSADLSGRSEILTAFGLDWIGRPDSVMADGPGWVPSDVEPIDLLRLYGPHAFVRLVLDPANSPARRVRDLITQGKRDELAQLRERFVQSAIWRGLNYTRGPLFPARREQYVMYAWRECEEMRKVLRDDRDTVLVWGSDHILGLTEILLRNAFTLTNTQWFDVVRRPVSDLPFQADRSC